MNWVLNAKQWKRLIADVVIATALMALYFSGIYTTFPAPVQLISLKMILVSMGFIHAHLIGQYAFQNVDWSKDEVATTTKYLRIALYVVFIYAYSQGG
jgi:hypothetical protein